MSRAHLTTILGLAAAFAIALPGVAAAHHPASSGGFSVQVEDAWGRPLRTYQHNGQTLVLGAYNERYNIRVRNHTGQRVEAVVSVDGRDAVSGDVGDYRNQRGYVVAPYGSVLVEGFRQSHAQVAAFRFTSPGDSYSARRGTPQNIGVIGVAVFGERHHRRQPIARPRPIPYEPWYGLDDGDRAAESAPAPPRAEARAHRRCSCGHVRLVVRRAT